MPIERSGRRCSTPSAAPGSGTTRSSVTATEMFGYFEADDLAAAAAITLPGRRSSTRWQDSMAELLDQRVPDAGPPALDEVFRLD